MNTLEKFSLQNIDHTVQPQRLGRISLKVLDNVDYISSFEDVHTGIAALAAGVTNKEKAKKLGLY